MSDQTTDTGLLTDYWNKNRDFGSDIDNEQRAAWGRETLQAFTNSMFGLDGDRALDEPEIVQQNLSDLLTYFMHFAGCEAFAAALSRATGGYQEDLDEEAAEDAEETD